MRAVRMFVPKVISPGRIPDWFGKKSRHDPFSPDELSARDVELPGDTSAVRDAMRAGIVSRPTGSVAS